MAPGRNILIIAPNSFDIFTGTTAENQFHVLTGDGGSASLARLDRLLVPSGRPALPLRERRGENPMAGYYLESFLIQRGYDARVVFDFDDDHAIRVALEHDPMAVLFSTTYVTDRDLLYQSIRRLRALIGDKPLVIGGPFVWKQKIEMEDLRTRPDAKTYLAEMRTFDADPLADNLFAGRPEPAARDTIFIGHEFGEYTLLSVLDYLARPGREENELLDIPNLILPGDDGTWIMTEFAREPVDLDRDFTRWDLVAEMPRIVPLRTSVGCPYHCKFCDFIELHPEVITRSPASIRTEIELALARGRSVFDFIDDNIFLSRKRIDQLTATLIQSGLHVQWGGFFRADRVDADNVESLMRSGCRFGLCGIESGDDRILKNMRKGTRAADLHRGLELSLAHGIYTALTFLVGFPGENRGTLDATIDFANTLPMDGRAFAFYQAYPFYVLPNTAVDRPDFRRRFGLRGRFARWSHDSMDATEAAFRWSRYFFKNVRLPYNYHGNDAPAWWSVERRNRAFAERKTLTDVFLRCGDDETVQASFERLTRIVREEDPAARGLPAPHWKDVLAARESQPGRRLPVERVGAFAPV